MALLTEQRIEQALRVMINTDQFQIERISDYFSEHYVQTVNGECLSYDEFISHMKLLHAAVKKMHVDIVTIASKDNKVMTHHHVYLEKENHIHNHFEVFAEFLFEDNKIVACRELTCMIKGEAGDADLGLRHA